MFITMIMWNNETIVDAQSTMSSAQPTSSFPPPTIQITSLQDGQRVPEGEITVKGVSSDNEETDCQVYADVNDVTPMRNVTASRG